MIDLNNLNVVGFFDGISCGIEALKRIGIKPRRYYASEIDKHAIQVARNSHPEIIHIGNITNLKGEYFEQIDVALAGSPCQGFSFAGNKLNFNDPRSALFFEFARMIKEMKPKYFLLENVPMKKEYQDVISRELGVEPIKIDSALVSAQSRKRLYWTNIPNVGQPEDRGLLLKDILETEGPFEWLSKPRSEYLLKLASLPGSVRKRTLKEELSPCPVKILPQKGDFIYNNHLGQNGVIFKKKAATLVCAGRHHVVSSLDGELRVRKLTAVECERLQTIRDGFTSLAGKSQRYKMIGNGWTVDVIAHILSCLVKDLNKETL